MDCQRGVMRVAGSLMTYMEMEEMQQEISYANEALAFFIAN